MSKILVETTNLKKTYKHFNGDITLFKNLSIKIKQGDLVALVGPSKAKEILITAKRYSALEAERMGLVNSCVPIDKLEAEVADITDRISQNAPLSMKASKLTINELMKDDSSFDEDLVDQLTRDCFNSKDYQEGQEAFMNKRQPVFYGK